ncbi:unnamed protein product [Prunus brigantina]
MLLPIPLGSCKVFRIENQSPGYFESMIPRYSYFAYSRGRALLGLSSVGPVVREEACSLDVVVLANDEVVGCWAVFGSSTKTLSSFGKVYQKGKWEEMEG